jgi:hypothetical protein
MQPHLHHNDNRDLYGLLRFSAAFAIARRYPNAPLDKQGDRRNVSELPHHTMAWDMSEETFRLSPHPPHPLQAQVAPVVELILAIHKWSGSDKHRRRTMRTRNVGPEDCFEGVEVDQTGDIACATYFGMELSK